MDQYQALKDSVIRGWNTWNTRSVLSHVHMPDALAINLCLKDARHAAYLKEADVGDKGAGQAIVKPGAHAFDGSYTRLSLIWYDIEIEVESGIQDDDLVLLVKPLSIPEYAPTLVGEVCILWNKPGYVKKEKDRITAVLEYHRTDIFTTGKLIEESYAITQTSYLSVKMDTIIGFSTGTNRELGGIQDIISYCREKHDGSRAQYGELSELYNAMQTCLAWDTIFEPKKNRIVSTVSRRWNKHWSGYVLFCWDNYFAACMAAFGSKAIAYSNLIEITREKTPSGFVPNFASALGASSLDRSQPPVGSASVLDVYKVYKEQWIIEEVYDDLIGWNNWWFEHRQIKPGLFAWGSDPYTPRVGHYSEIDGVNQLLGAALESGLDNSPMYDDIPFDASSHMMQLADVGLTGLVIMDCRALLELGEAIGRLDQRDNLLARLALCEQAIQQLWCETDGFFYNKRMDTMEFVKRISPTNFYALYSHSVTPTQCERVINEHFYNPNEFWGEYIMPSIARNDPAYPEQEYWRGRIWAPMNYLVYNALKTHNLSKPAKDLADRSAKLIMKEWLEHGHVHENYSGDNGEGCNSKSSDAFYHWGGLLALIALKEAGFIK